MGCGVCVQACPKGVKMAEDGKAEIFNQQELEKCGGQSICPFGNMEKKNEKSQKSQDEKSGLTKNSQDSSFQRPNNNQIGGQAFGRRMGLGRGMGRGMDRGMGRGRDRGGRTRRGIASK